MSPWQRRCHFLAYLVWGCGTSFALASDAGVWLQSAALLPPLLFWCWNAPRRCLTLMFVARAGRLACLAAVVVLLSAALNDCSLSAVLRYLSLWPAFLVLLLSAEDQASAVDALRALALAGLLFCALHAGSADWSRFFDPQYRIELFLNTNGVGFIAAMTALALLGAWTAVRPRRKLVWLLLALPLAVLFLSRSRTATSSFLAGLLAYLWVRLRGIPWKTRLSGLALLALLGWAFLWQPFFEAVSNYYSLFDKYRNISNATNRTEIWAFMLTQVIPQNLFFGVGPGQHEQLVQSALGYSSAHNGLLQYLGDVGLVGTLPYLLLLNDARQGAASAWGAACLPLLVGGLVESVGETMFFSVGNAGSLLFLLAVLSLARRKGLKE